MKLPTITFSIGTVGVGVFFRNPVVFTVRAPAAASLLIEEEVEGETGEVQRLGFTDTE